MAKQHRLKTCACGRTGLFEWESECPSCDQQLFVREGKAHFDLSTMICYADYPSFESLAHLASNVLGNHFHECYHYLQFVSSSYGLLWAFASSIQAHDVMNVWKSVQDTAIRNELTMPLSLPDEVYLDYQSLERFKRVTLFGGLKHITLGRAFDALGIGAAVATEFGWDPSAPLPVSTVFEPNAIKAGTSWIKIISGVEDAQEYWRSHLLLPSYSFATIVGDALNLPRQTIEMLLDMALLAPLTPFFRAHDGSTSWQADPDISNVLESVFASDMYFTSEAAWEYGPVGRFLAALEVVRRKPELAATEINDDTYLQLYEGIANDLDWLDYETLLAYLGAFCVMAMGFTPTKYGQNVGDSWVLKWPWSSYKSIFTDLFGKCFEIRRTRPSIFADTVACLTSPEIGRLQFQWAFKDRFGIWSTLLTKEDMKQSAMTLAFSFINSTTCFLVRGGTWKCVLEHSCKKGICSRCTKTYRESLENCDGLEWFKTLLGILPGDLVRGCKLRQ